MRTVLIGNRKIARHLFQHMSDEGWNVCGIIAPKGELAAKQANFTPFDELASETDCSVYKTDDINSPKSLSWLDDINPDICLCGGWSQIIDETVLNVPDNGFLGLHSSPLPKGRGGAPVNWSIINGDGEVGLTLFYYEQGVDAGEIVAQGTVPIEPRDDVSTVFDALAVEACEIVSSVREKLERREVDTVSQSIDDATYRPRRQPQDGLIDWNRSQDDQYNWVRAQTNPYPGAYTFYNEERLTIWEGEPADKSSSDADAGEVLDVIDGKGVDVRTGDGAFRITRVQADNRPPRWADDYAREVGLEPGDCLTWKHAPEKWLYTGMRQLLHRPEFNTNLSVGESGEIEIVALSGSRRELTARMAMNDNRLFERSVCVDGEYSETVEYTPTDPGVHTISVGFEADNERIDTRYLKVFAHE